MHAALDVFIIFPDAAEMRGGDRGLGLRTTGLGGGLTPGSYRWPHFLGILEALGMPPRILQLGSS